MELVLVEYRELDEKKKKAIDDFILNENTNGEFINTNAYLSYHGDKFIEDNVCVFDRQSWTVKGVVFGVNKGDGVFISHLGTTFAGPIVNLNDSYSCIKEVVDMIMDYYENRYDELYFKMSPQLFTKHPADVIMYILMKRHYNIEGNGLSNVISLKGIDDEDDVFKMYDSKKRNQVKKALKNSSFVFKRTNLVSEEAWSYMNDNLNRKYGTNATHSYKEICELQRRMPNNIESYEVRTTDGKYAALGIIYVFKNVFHTQYLDFNYEFSGEYPNLYLIHQLLLESIRRKYKVFSFGVSTEKGGEILNETLYAYKKGYGGGSMLMPVMVKHNKKNE